MEIVRGAASSIGKMNYRRLAEDIIGKCLILISCIMVWKGLLYVLPAVAVVSGSMEPGFTRGDLFILTMSNAPIQVGDIVLYNVEGRQVPIIHRVVKVHQRRETGKAELLTKGDNNLGDDGPLYAQGQLWLQRHHITGRAVWFLPYFGWMSIIANENTYLKYILLGTIIIILLHP